VIIIRGKNEKKSIGLFKGTKKTIATNKDWESKYAFENRKYRVTKRINNFLNKMQIYKIELELQNENLCKMLSDLEQSHSKYFELYNFAPIGYCRVSKNGRIEDVNNTMALMLGVDKEYLVKNSITNFIFSESLEIYNLYKNKLFETKEAQTFEIRMYNRDHTIFWAQLKTTIVEDLNKIPVCNLVVVDVSKYKFTESELQKSERKYRSLFESTREVILNTAEIRRQANEKEKLGDYLEINNDHKKHHAKQVCSAHKELNLYQIKLEVQNEELRCSQVALDAVRLRYFEFFNHAPIGYGIINDLSAFLEVNLMLMAFFGVNNDTIDRYYLTDFIIYEDLNIYYMHQKDLFETGEPQTFELRMYRSEGSIFLAHIESKLARNNEGEQICYLVILDISKYMAEVKMNSHEYSRVQDFLEDIPIEAELSERQNISTRNKIS